jgi:hypothetical protein
VLGRYFSPRPGTVGLAQRPMLADTTRARPAWSPRGQRREHEDGEGRSPSKKDGGAAPWGSGADEAADGAALLTKGVRR